MTKRRYRKVVRKLDDSGFAALKGSTDSKKFDVLYENLWGMFGMTAEVCESRMASLIRRKVPRGQWPSVSDYAWTEEVKEAFYSHPLHKRFCDRVRLRYGTDWAMWMLQCEPSDYKGPNTAPNRG